MGFWDWVIGLLIVVFFFGVFAWALNAIVYTVMLLIFQIKGGSELANKYHMAYWRILFRIIRFILIVAGCFLFINWVSKGKMVFLLVAFCLGAMYAIHYAFELKREKHFESFTNFWED